MFYTTSNGNEVKFGRYGWVYLTKNVPHGIFISETDEIWKEWSNYWKGR